METITKNYKVYRFSELSDEAKNHALWDQANFETEIINEESPYYGAVVQMKRMQTPWFLGETIRFDYEELLIDTIEANDYKFLEDGTFFNL